MRSQVYRRIHLPSLKKTTAARVGQVLQNLHAHGYLDRETDRYQGRSKASFYRLNEKGRKICSEHYGFNYQDRALFRTTEDMRQKYLTANYFAGSHDAPSRRIIGFYSYSGGLGQTSMVAHTANGLALLAKRKKILVVDFDTGAPELDRFFLPKGIPEDDRGLRGLLVDFHQQPDYKKASWLKEAMASDAYLSQPRPEAAPNLYYLRSGMENTTVEADIAERSQALNLLLSELGLSGGTSSNPDGTEAHFLPLFRAALQERFHIVLMDSHAGRSSSALALTQIADQLIISARPSESDQTLLGLQSVIAWYLREQEEEKRSGAGVLVALHLSEYGTGELDGLGWVRDKLLCDESPSRSLQRQLWPIRHYQGLQNPTDWGLTKIYEPLSKRILGIHTDEVYLPPGTQALTILLDPKTSKDFRSLMRAQLEKANHVDFARYLQALIENGTLVPQTDEMGLKMLEKIFAVHCEKATALLQE